MIVTRHLSVATKSGTQLLHQVDVNIGAGSFHAICGANGSGKTTLLRTLCGLQKTTSGSVFFERKSIETLNELERAKLMSWVPAEQPMTFNYSVSEVVSWGRWPHHRGFLTSEDRKYIDKALATMNVSQLRERMMTELSLGEQKRVHLARAVAADTPYVFLDEPCGPLDAGMTLDVMDWIKHATQELGKTVVASLHDVALVANFADTATLLDHGAILAHGETAEVLTDQCLQQAFGVRMESMPGPNGKLILLCRPN